MSMFRTVTYGLTHDGQTGFSAVPDEPNMATLQRNRHTEMWSNNKLPYYASYAPNGVVIYPADDSTPWKRREYNVAPPYFEGTRFRFTKDELSDRTATISALRQSQELRKTKR